MLVDVGVPPAATPAPVAPLPGTPELDLLGLVDPVLDAVQGTWTRESGSLLSDGPAAILEIPYLPPEEYSFTIEFVRRAGNDPVLLLLPRGGKPVVCPLGSSDWPVENGRTCLATVEVRKDRTTVWFNNRKLGEIDGHAGPWRLRHDGLPGLATASGAVEFRKIRLFELRGRGRPLRTR